MNKISPKDYKEFGLYLVNRISGYRVLPYVCHYSPNDDGTTTLTRANKEDYTDEEINSSKVLTLSNTLYHQVIRSNKKAIRKLHKSLCYFTDINQFEEIDSLPDEFPYTLHDTAGIDNPLHDLQVKVTDPAYLESLTLSELTTVKRTCEDVIKGVNLLLTKALK